MEYVSLFGFRRLLRKVVPHFLLVHLVKKLLDSMCFLRPVTIQDYPSLLTTISQGCLTCLGRMECASSTGLAKLCASFGHRCSPIDQLSKQIPAYTLISYPFIPLTSYSEFQEDDNGIYIGLETNKIRVKVQQVQHLHPNLHLLALEP